MGELAGGFFYTYQAGVDLILGAVFGRIIGANAATHTRQPATA